jgi:hypothetical protein
MPTTVTPRSANGVGDPRLAKLKEASLTRRRVPPTEYSIPAFREDAVGDHEAGITEIQHLESNTSASATAAATPSCSGLTMATQDALHILKLDSATGEGVDDSTRLHRLQAVRSLASTESGPAADHLCRRLRSTTAQLAFHEANASIQATTRKYVGENNTPWLPSSTTAGSKHKAAQLQAQKKKANTTFKENAKPPRPSPQASALQAKLLSGLKDRLQLKAVFLALRQAVQQRRVVESLVERAVAVEKYALLQNIFRNWKQSTLPSREMVCAAEFYEYERQIYVAKEALRMWNAWSRAQHQRRQAAAVGAAAHRHGLLAASFAHWKFYTSMKHLSMLRSALVEGWTETWGHRKALLAWRRTARRQHQQRDALLAATTTTSVYARDSNTSAATELALEIEIIEEDHVVPGQFSFKQPEPTLAEAAAHQRALIRNQLSGLELCIAEVAKELKSTRSRLRWTSFNDKATTSIPSRPQYNPAAYSSPVKRRRQGYDGNSSGSGSNPALAAAEDIAAELFNCNVELEFVENECQALREKLKSLEDGEEALLSTEATEYLLTAQQAEKDVSVAMMALDDAENELHESQVVSDIVDEEIEVQKALLTSCLHDASTYRSAADAAAAALASARHEFQTSTASVEVWTRRVTLAAAELSRVAPNNKPAAALKLKEARHRLEMEKHAAIEADQKIPNLVHSLEESVKMAEKSESALIAAQQSAIAASAAEAAASSALNSAQAAFSAAETALKESQDHEITAISLYNATMEKAAALQEDARQIRLQLFTREREVALLQAQVTELDERHAQFVALSLEYQQISDDVQLLEETSLINTPDDDDDGVDVGVDARPSAAVEADDDDDDEVDNILSHVEDTETTLQWSVTTTPISSPSKEDPLSLAAAARSFYRSRLLRRAVHALQSEAALWKELNALSSYGFCVSILPRAFEAWKEAAADAVAIDGTNIEIVRVLSCLKAWRSYTSKLQLLRKVEADCVEINERQQKAVCFAVLRENIAIQQRHRYILTTAALSRKSSLFTAWRMWAAEQRQLAETLHVALERRRLGCLSSCMQQWRTNSHNTALLRRVFAAACDSWRSSLGASGYEADFALLQQSFSAWQVGAHIQREERRDGVLALAAESSHARTLLHTAFTALRKEAEWAKEKESYIPLAHAALLSWRDVTLNSESHMASLAAQQYYENRLKHKVLDAWNSYATALACSVSVFYLKWQIDQPRRLVLAAWRQVVSERQKWELRRAEAEALRNKHSYLPQDAVALTEIEVNSVQMEHQQNQHRPTVHWATPVSCSTNTLNSRTSAGTTPSSGARSVTPVMGSTESWHAKAAEWRQRQDFHSGAVAGIS